jgi:hypothetical protein
MSKLVGNPTTRPIRKALANLKGKPESIPVIKTIIVRVIAKSIPSVMSNAKSTVEYLLSIFISLSAHPQVIKRSSKACADQNLRIPDADKDLSYLAFQKGSIATGRQGYF